MSPRRAVFTLVTVLLVLTGCAAPSVSEASPSAVSMCGDTPADAENRARLTSLDAEYQSPVAARGTENNRQWCVFGTPLSPAQYWVAVYAGDRPTVTWDLVGFPSVRLFTDGWSGFVTGEDGRPWTVRQASAAARKLARSLG